MATTIQNLHSLTAGNKPGDLMPGEIAYNVADGFVYLGNGSNALTDTLGQQIGTPTVSGMGWQQAIFNAAPITGGVVLAGIYDAQDNLVTSVTAAGTAAGFTVGALPAAAPANEGYYVLVQIGGNLTAPAPAGTAQPGDWLVSSGTGWALVAESSVVIPASNVNIIPTGDFTGPSMQDVLNQIQLLYVTIADGAMSQLQCNGDASVFGNTTLGDANTDTLTVNATSSFTAPVTATGTVQVGGAFTANSTGYVVGNFRVDGDIDARGNVSLGNAITDTVTIAGPITAGNNLTVAGSTTLNGATAITGSLTTTGSVSLAGTAGVTVSTNVTVGSGGVTFNASSVSLQGAATLNVTSTATTTISGNLNLEQGGNSKAIIYSRPGAGAPVRTNLNSFLVIPGTIIAYGKEGSSPDGYLWCNGDAYSRTAYPDLFAAIGTTWGAGDGSTTFNVPNLLGLFLRGASSSANPKVKTSSGANPSGGAAGSYSTDSFSTHSHAFQVNTFGYQAAFSSQRECLGLATNQMNSQGRPNNGTLTLETGGGGSVPVQNSGASETKPVSASVVYFIKF
jgi:microcystin-dependent protein